MPTYANDIYKSIGFDLKDERGIDFQVPLFLDYLNRAIRRLAFAFARGGFNINKKSGNFALTAGTHEYDLTTKISDFMAEDRFYISTTTTPLVKMDDELELMEYVGDTSRGEPAKYFIRGDTLILRPIPDATDTLVAIYWYWPTKIVDVSGAVPFNRIFDDSIRQFILMMAQNRDEYTTEMENAFFADLEDKALGIAYLRGEEPKIIPYAYPKAAPRKYR